ncbi:hypothetical protein VNO77_04184 [Canavalia gladiata]|uniref:Uncharacterized protein n=1 Tax=Canavalia gladiata TaxID=3824 RepID=A0AAN9MW67_CANGL
MRGRNTIFTCNKDNLVSSMVSNSDVKTLSLQRVLMGTPIDLYKAPHKNGFQQEAPQEAHATDKRKHPAKRTSHGGSDPKNPCVEVPQTQQTSENLQNSSGLWSWIYKINKRKILINTPKASRVGRFFELSTMHLRNNSTKKRPYWSIPSRRKEEFGEYMTRMGWKSTAVDVIATTLIFEVGLAARDNIN